MIQGLLLAALAAVPAPQERAPSCEELRWQVRPSLVEIADRVLHYAIEGDFRRARRAASALEAYRRALPGHDGIVYLDPLEGALERGDAAGVELGVRVLVRTDLHFLLLHLGDDSVGRGASPRTRLLMAKQDLEFLTRWLPKGEEGEDARRLFPLIYGQLAKAVPGKAAYSAHALGWQEEAVRLGKKMELALDAAFPRLKLPAPPAAGASPAAEAGGTAGGTSARREGA